MKLAGWGSCPPPRTIPITSPSPTIPANLLPERDQEPGFVEQPETPESMWEAIVLTIRDLGIDLTRGEANE